MLIFMEDFQIEMKAKTTYIYFLSLYSGLLINKPNTAF